MQQSELAKRAAAEEANELRRQKEILAQVERARAEAAEAGEAGPVQVRDGVGHGARALHWRGTCMGELIHA